MARQKETLEEAKRVLDAIMGQDAQINKETRERLQQIERETRERLKRYLRTIKTGDEAREWLQNR